jgi:hypothetical protein
VGLQGTWGRDTVLPTNETKEKLEIVIPTFVIKLEQAKEDEVV